MIQADGNISVDETGIFGMLLHHLDLEPEDITIAGRWLKEPQDVSEEQLSQAFQEPGAKEMLTAVFSKIAEADDELDPKEKELLERLSRTAG